MTSRPVEVLAELARRAGLRGVEAMISEWEIERRKMATASARLYRFAKHTPGLPDYVREEIRLWARRAATMARALRR